MVVVSYSVSDTTCTLSYVVVVADDINVDDDVNNVAADVDIIVVDDHVAANAIVNFCYNTNFYCCT